MMFARKIVVLAGNVCSQEESDKRWKVIEDNIATVSVMELRPHVFWWIEVAEDSDTDVQRLRENAQQWDATMVDGIRRIAIANHKPRLLGVATTLLCGKSFVPYNDVCGLLQVDQRCCCTSGAEGCLNEYQVSVHWQMFRMMRNAMFRSDISFEPLFDRVVQRFADDYVMFTICVATLLSPLQWFKMVTYYTTIFGWNSNYATVVFLGFAKVYYGHLKYPYHHMDPYARLVRDHCDRNPYADIVDNPVHMTCRVLRLVKKNYPKGAKTGRIFAYLQRVRLLEVGIALSSLQLCPYVVLNIIGFLPHMKSLKHGETIKVLKNIQDAMRRRE